MAEEAFRLSPPVVAESVTAINLFACTSTALLITNDDLERQSNKANGQTRAGERETEKVLPSKTLTEPLKVPILASQND